MLVFTEFVPTQAMLAEFLESRGFSIVLLNGAAAVLAAGAASDWPEAIAAARASVDTGRAREALEKLVRVSQSES